MQIGDTLPPLSFETTKGPSSFEQLRGQWVILYFYPKDATPGCTTEGCDFRDYYKDYEAANAVILGVSRDSLASHHKFKAKESFPFELISDNQEALCSLFDVIKMKSMYGKQVRGIERSTFIIDPKGVLRQAFRKVAVPKHVSAVLETLRSLAKEG